MGPGMEQLECMGPGPMGPNTVYKNIRIGPRQGKEQGSIVSYYSGPVPCTVPVPCRVNKPRNFDNPVDKITGKWNVLNVVHCIW